MPTTTGTASHSNPTAREPGAPNKAPGQYMLPPRIPKKPKRESRWRTSAADGDFNQSVSPETLRELLSYDPATGSLVWNKRCARFFQSEREQKIWNTRYAGKQALCVSRGRGRVRVLGIGFAAHRVVWAIHYGEWPTLQIDHINGEPLDNRIANLRQVTNEENSRNIKLPANNTSGRIGVSRRKCGDWRAEICVDQQRINLGVFPTLEAASEARAKAERQHGFHPNHGRVAHG